MALPGVPPFAWPVVEAEFTRPREQSANARTLSPTAHVSGPQSRTRQASDRSPDDIACRVLDAGEGR
jgi:hypothetical protein